MSDYWGCDCGGVVNKRSGVKSHKPECKSHHGRCCDCCQTHVDPCKGCWIDSSASVVSGTTVKEQQ